jgi:hypothetical protein
MSGTPVPVNDAPEFRVNVQTAGDQGTYGHRTLAADAQGNFVVAWAGSPAGSSATTVYARRYDAAGNALGGEFQVNTQAGVRGWPSVAMNASGNFLVTWESAVTSGRTTTYGIRGRRYDASGTPLGGEFQVAATGSGGGGATGGATAMAEDGSFVAVYERTTPKSGKVAAHEDVYAQRFGPDGATLGTEARVNDAVVSGRLVVLGSVAMDGSGDFLVAWQNHLGDANEWDVYAKGFAASGAAQGPESRVNTQTAGRQTDPSAAVLPGGGFAVAWEDNRLDGSGSYGDIRLRRHDGAGWSSGEVAVNTTTAAHQGAPSLDADAEGNVTVIWQSNGQDGSSHGMYGQQYDAAGQPAGSEFQLNTFTAGDQAWSSVAAQPGGRFVAAWTSVGQDGSGQGVYARLFQQAQAEPAPAPEPAFGDTSITDPSAAEDEEQQAGTLTAVESVGI